MYSYYKRQEKDAHLWNSIFSFKLTTQFVMLNYDTLFMIPLISFQFSDHINSTG